jgi:hypothetical protein
VTTVESLQGQLQHTLRPLAKDQHGEYAQKLLGSPALSPGRHGFDKGLLQLDGWATDPGIIILPVDGGNRLQTKQILRLDLRKVVLIRGGKSTRSVGWEQVRNIYLLEGEVAFEIIDEPTLTIAGYRHPEQILSTIEKCYKAATERILQALGNKVIHAAP